MNEGFRMELACCEHVILREITDADSTRKDIAQTYALTLRSSECETVDWAKVNQAIIDRWSVSALKWIKQQAWSGKCFEQERAKTPPVQDETLSVDDALQYAEEVVSLLKDPQTHAPVWCRRLLNAITKLPTRFRVVDETQPVEARCTCGTVMVKEENYGPSIDCETAPYRCPKCCIEPETQPAEVRDA